VSKKKTSATSTRRKVKKESILQDIKKKNREMKTGNQKQKRIKMPDPPDYINEVAKEEWHRLVKLLSKYGIITELDTTALTFYCEAYADWRRADEELKQPGQDIVMRGKGGSGGMYRNPWFDIKQKCEQKIFKYLALFGLSPADRAKLDIDAGDEDESNPFAKL
jgi:P27 family predicted phage terminase small subunit